MGDVAGQQGRRRGTFTDGSEYETWGAGPKVLLYLPGGPGSSIPTGLGGWMSRRWFEPFVDAGYAVHVVTRRRRMPRGHGVTDMADDVAELISQELGGRADLVVGVSFGGMIAQHLAARHGALLGHVAVIVAAAEVCDWGKDVDRRLAQAVASGDRVRTGMTFAEYVAPSRRARLAASPGRPLARKEPALREALPAGGPGGRDRGRAGVRLPVRPPEDRGAGPVRVRGPGPVLHARRGRTRPHRSSPAAALVWHEGKGHVAVASSGRVPEQVLEFVGRG